MRQIVVEVREEQRARVAATELLPDSAGAAAPPWRAAWVGSAAALGALGVHRDEPVDADALAAVLRGRNARDGAEVRMPDVPAAGKKSSVATYELTMPASPELDREWATADPWRREEIGRRLMAAASDALEQIREHTPLIITEDLAGKSYARHARGLAAVAIVDPPDERGDGLRVRTAILGLEHADGILGAPDAETMIQTEANAVVAFGKRLEELRLAPPPSAERAPAMVGRDQAWVIDPLEAWREHLGETNAAQIHANALLLGERYAELDDTQLAELAGEVGAPFERLDTAQAASSLTAERERDAAAERLMRAREDTLVVEDRLGQPFRLLGPRPIDSNGRPSQWVPGLAARETAARAVARLHEHEALRADELNAANERAAQSYLQNWMTGQSGRATEWLALTRELTVREREQELAARDSAERVERDPPSNATTIGRGDVADALAGLREDRLDRRAVGRLVTRDDISAPKAAERLQGVIAADTLADLAGAAERLAPLLAEASDAHVRARQIELGPPDKGLDRGAAREVLRIRAAAKVLEAELDELGAKIITAGDEVSTVFDEDLGMDFVLEADGLTDPEIRHFNSNQQKILTLTAQEHQLGEQNRHPDRYLADRDRIVRALAYADEGAIRRELDVQRELQRSLAEPPQHIVDLVGRLPDEDAPERAEYESVVRDVELHRLRTEANLRDGIALPPERGLADQRRLDTRIDRLRDAHGMEPLAKAAEVEAPDMGV